MSDEQALGPIVPDAENALRAITYKHWWAESLNRPSSAAFNEDVFSVDIESRTTPQATASRFRDVTLLAKFNCGFARKLEFDTREEKDEFFPDNEAHAHVYFGIEKSYGNEKRKRHAKKLATECETVRIT